MIIWIALRRIFAKHFFYHLAIPLLGGAAAELWAVPYFAPSATEAVGIRSLFTMQHLIPIGAILVSYILVMLFIITAEASVPFETANFSKVEQQLSNATGYFALCDISMREWFEPGAFQYFSLLQSKKEADDTFKYERVIVFKTAVDKLSAEASIVDGYYSKALATSHTKLKIPMGWLPANEFSEILRAVPTAQEHLFRKVSPSLRWLPHLVLKLFPAQVDFAVIDRPAGQAVIIVPFKKKDALVLEGTIADPYLKVAKAIREKVYDRNGAIRIDHDFPRLLGLTT